MAHTLTHDCKPKFKWQVVDETHLKMYVWYDNEFGYCNRMLDVAKMVGKSL